MKMLRIAAVALAACLFSIPALAQWQVQSGAYAIGRGSGTGFASLLCGSAELAVGQTAAAPICRTVSGDATFAATGALTLATVNSNIGSFGSATQCVAVTTNGKGLITAVSHATCTPAIGSITGLGTGVGTWLATPSSANLASALTDETGTGAAMFGTAPTVSGLFNVSGAIKYSTQSAPSQITSNQNDYNPSSVVCATSTTLLINSDAARDITGLAGGVAGCVMMLVNNGSQTITLKEASASSTAANRFSTGGDIALAASASVTLLYDGTASRWRMASPASAGGGSGSVTSISPGAGLQNAGTTSPITTSGTLSLDGAFGFRNRIINPSGQIWQVQNTGAAAITDATYAFDQWYGLTQSAGVTASQVSAAENGTPYMMRLSQANASAQRFGIAQPLETANVIDLRGQAVVLSARVRMSASTTLRYAIVEWTGTADSVTKDVVNDWTSGTFTTGNFFKSTTTTICGTGSTALTANTLADITALTCTPSGSMNNLIVFFWTDSTQAQNVTLDVGKVQLEAGLAATTHALRPFTVELGLAERYYQKSYDIATAPGTATTTGQIAARSPATGGTNMDTFQKGIMTRFRTAPTMTWYSPATGTAARFRDFTGAADVTVTGTTGNGETTTGFPTCASGPTATNLITAHYVADARM